MKKYLKSMVIALLVAPVAFGLAACDKTNASSVKDNDGKKSEVEAPIVAPAHTHTYVDGVCTCGDYIYKNVSGFFQGTSTTGFVIQFDLGFTFEAKEDFTSISDATNGIFVEYYTKNGETKTVLSNKNHLWNMWVYEYENYPNGAKKVENPEHIGTNGKVSDAVGATYEKGMWLDTTHTVNWSSDGVAYATLTIVKDGVAYAVEVTSDTGNNKPVVA